MRTEKITVYTFEELSEDAKNKAIENNIDINLYQGWWEYIYEDAERVGIRLNSFDLDRNLHATGNFLLSAAEVAANILKEHGNSCGTYESASMFLDIHDPLFAEYMSCEDENPDRFIELEDELKEVEDEFLENLLSDYASILQKEYEYLYSDEAIIETLISNGHEFTQDGISF